MHVTRPKGDETSTATAEVLVIASNTTTSGSIGDAWLSNGLSQGMLKTKCIKNKPAPCTVNCTVIWLEANCDVLDESHISINVTETNPALARLVVDARVLTLADGTYNFAIHPPVSHANSSYDASINGSFIIDGNPACEHGFESVSSSDNTSQCIKCKPGGA